MSNKTALYQQHLDAGAKMVDFFGWQMPLHYGSQVEEHHSVRRDAGMFDVSHMTVVDIDGTDAKPFLRHLLANDVAKLTAPGKALYSAMLNEQGGVIDDLIVYFLDDTHYRMVVNSATREKDLAWIRAQANGYDVDVVERPELAMLSVQGPKAKEKAAKVFNYIQNEIVNGLKPFFGVHAGDLFIATTGYTGESGYEIILFQHQVAEIWQKFLDVGVTPAGLGARDTLRLEAGMNLYGQDMDETVSPLAANMGWTISWQPEDRQFIGRDALEQAKANGSDKLVGLVMTSRGVLRAGTPVIAKDDSGNELKGVVTSGTFSPTLGHAIALARVPKAIGTKAEVELRGKRIDVQVVSPCFVRNGKSTF